MYSNVRSLDVICKPIEYINRAKELDGDKAIYFTTEHGYQGNIFETHTLCKNNNIKMIVGSEVYYVYDRKEKDKSNYHLVIIAKNKEGYKQLNYILSKANEDGFYYKPRIDDELLFNLNPNNFIITTACVAGRLRDEEGLDEWLIKMKNYFKDNFYLEVQSHSHISQVEHNKKILQLKNKFNIPIIHANDSHYINKEDAKYRDLFLKAKGIVYPEEEGFILDYPSYDEIVERYKLQGVLSDEDIIESLENTLIFDKFEGLKLDYDIKIPHISDNPNKELKEIINREWEKESKNIPTEEHDKYIEAIRYEIDIIEKCNMEEYFILDYKIVNKAINKYNGMLTKTGRGSAVSFYVNKLLGLTEIDRLKSPITLYPTRFMSTERILKTKSLPDIDLNSPSREEFILATKDLLGEENCGWMLAFKPMQDASAFRLYCKALDMKVEQYDEVAKNLEEYEEHEKWKDIIKESKHFVGVVESISPSPCSMLLYDKPLAEEIGFIKTKDGMCVNIDGYNCDVYKYLKNDYLAVLVWDIIRKTCELANIKVPTINELDEMLDEKTFDIYKNKLTCTINQADSKFATDLVAKYQVSSVSEMSAFVACIRPGFASLLDNFIERKPYTTGVKELDDLLKDSYHYLMYQESIMKYLIWLGIEESESYDIIKKIAKKKFKENELKELKEKLQSGWINQQGNLKGFEETWQVVNDASKYSFNASHSLSYAYDSLYGAYLKSHYPLEYYTVALNLYEGDNDRTPKLTEELDYFGITLKEPKFRYASASYTMDKENNAIYKGIASIKFLNSNVADGLYSLRDNQYDSFIDLLIDIKNISINSRQLDILIKLGFFSEFGGRKYLLDIVEIFNNMYGKKQFKRDKLPCKEEFIRQFATTETEKMFKNIDTLGLCKFLVNNIPNEELTISEIIKAEIEYYGSPVYINKELEDNTLIVLEVNTKYTPKLKMYSPISGNTETVKISKKDFKKQPLEVGDMMLVFNIYEKNKKTKDNKGKWIELDDSEYWIDDYKIIKE
jgi:DNA polymerase III alpha subunit